MLDHSKIKSNEVVYDISIDIQNVFTDTTDKSLKKFNDEDRVIHRDIL